MTGQNPRQAGMCFAFEMSVFEAGYLAGLLALQQHSPQSSRALDTLRLGERLVAEALKAERQAVEQANARYLGRRGDDGR